MSKKKKSISDKKCIVHTCDKPTHGLGYCQGHYVQIKKHGEIINETLRCAAPKRANLPKIIQCEGCGKSFDRGKAANRKFCSYSCSIGHRVKSGKWISCLICGKKFYISNHRQETAKYCSTKCKGDSLKKTTNKFVCEYCGKEYHRGQSYIKWQEIREVKHHFCSISCGMKFRPKGEHHPNWNGGISRAYLYGYHTKEYKQWRDDVFKRDDFTCQLCHVRGTYLHAHHIKGFSKYPDLRFTLSNGITLCKKCHMGVHSKECKKINDLQKYLNREAMKDRGKREKASRIKNYYPSGEQPVLKGLVVPVNIQIAQ